MAVLESRDREPTPRGSTVNPECPQSEGTVGSITLKLGDYVPALGPTPAFLWENALCSEDTVKSRSRVCTEVNRLPPDHLRQLMPAANVTGPG